MRRGGLPEKPDLSMLCRLFYSMFDRLSKSGYFDEAFGYRDQSNDPVEGTLGPDIGAEMFRRLKKTDLYPIHRRYQFYSEDDLFDVIEFLYDCVSKHERGTTEHGMLYERFNADAGRQEFRLEINDLLRDYGDGYELSEEGEILSLGAEEMRPLLEQELPQYDPENVDSRVQSAVHRFRYHTASAEDKREAVSQLANVLEFLRPKLKGVLPSKDEGDLFNIANNFAIRHHNPAQKTQYDEGIWLDWIFYCYLNTIHVSVNLLKRAEENSQ